MPLKVVILIYMKIRQNCVHVSLRISPVGDFHSLANTVDSNRIKRGRNKEKRINNNLNLFALRTNTLQ